MERHETPLFGASERRELWAARQADSPLIAQGCVALGLAVALALGTGLGLFPGQDWGGAVLAGFVVAVVVRAGLLATLALRKGAWHAWRRHEPNETAIDRLSVGGALALFLCLATGGNGIGPAVPLIEATLAAVGAGVLLRGLLTLLRWP